MPNVSKVKAAPPQRSGSNSQAMVEAWLDKCRELGGKTGSAEGLKANAKLAWWEDMAERAKRDEIRVDNLPDGYAAYQQAREKANPNRRLSRRAKKAGGTDAGERMSEGKRVITVCQLPNIDGLKAFSTAVRVATNIRDVKGDTTTLVYKLLNFQFSKPDQQLKADEMEHYLHAGTKPKPKKTLADEAAVVQKAVDRLIAKWGAKSHLRAAYTSLGALIEAEGGTTAQQERAARDAARASKRKKK
jgi:hypothetical protein